MKPHAAMSCFCHKQSYLKTISNLLSLLALILSLLGIMHFSYRHVLLQLNYYASATNPSSSFSSSSLASVNSSATTISAADATNSSSGKSLARDCNLFRGEWVPDPEGPYYTNMTCSLIQDHQNCMRYGRPDTEFLKWRWRPEGCELPRFDPRRFLDLVRGKSMAFVGDSLARNHMQSLLCLLSRVANPEDISITRDENKRFFYSAYNFTISIFWSPFLVKYREAGDNFWNLYLDEADDNWASRVEHLDYLVVSAGTWFTRPSMYFKSKRILGCNYCPYDNVTMVTIHAANRAAFRAAFKAMRGFKGVAILRTVSPSHFENGRWDEGGSCGRTQPVARGEMRLEGVELEMYKAQVKELKKAKRENKGLRVELMDATAAMLMRPDGHPNVYGHRPEQRVQMPNDCVHWCLPGPIDMWNNLLLQMLAN